LGDVEPVFDDNGRPRGAVAVFSDITQHLHPYSCGVFYPLMRDNSIAEWVSEAAVDAVRAQCLLDSYYLRDLAEFQKVFEASPETARQVLRQIVPLRQVIADYQIELSLAVGQAIRADFRLGAGVLNANSVARFRLRQEHHSRIRVTVVTCPISQPTSPKEKPNA
jgi:hypothetical protein